MAEVEFRDGKREVPDHVAAMMAGLATYTMTHAQAIRAAERRMLGDHVFRAQQGLIDAHFRKVP